MATEVVRLDARSLDNSDEDKQGVKPMANGRRVLPIVLVLCACVTSFASEGADQLPWRDAKPFASATAGVTVKLSTDRARARIQGDLEVDIEFGVEKGSTWLYNPFLDRDILLPGRLVLCNQTGEPLCDLFDSWLLPRRSPRERDFLFLYYGQRIGGKQTVKIPEHVSRTGGAKLLPGMYYLQYVADGLSFSAPVDLKVELTAVWFARYPGRSVMRSNTMPIELFVE